MNKDKNLSEDELVKKFKNEFKTKVKKTEIRKRPAGTGKKESIRVWMKIDKTIFKDFIKNLCNLQFPHLAVISGNDLGKTIELIYHFTLNYGTRMNEIQLNLSVELPKPKPEIETICDCIPGALISEQEKQEMLGVKIKGIPDDSRCFLPDDFPKDMYPWRRDEKGADKLYKNLHESEVIK